MAKTVTNAKLHRLLGLFGLILGVLLLAGAAGAWKGQQFANTQVKNQLKQERIFFPAKGTPALDPKTFPGLQQYAGQQVDNGIKAKAYADEYIWVHMMKSSSGKTYAEVSTAAMANPSDQKLAGLKNTLFQGDMLRSSLLTAYAFSVFGTIAGYAVIGLIAAAAMVILLSLTSLARSRQN